MKNKIVISMMVSFAMCLYVAAADDYTMLSNGNFEVGTLAGWSLVNGNGAWGGSPISNEAAGIVGWEKDWYGVSGQNSGGWDENTTGTLRSLTFNYPSNGIVFFRLGGMKGPSGDENYDWVVLKLASDGSELAKVQAPGTPAMSLVSMSSALAYGQDCYIDCIDDRAGSWGWFCVDEFRVVVDGNDAKRDFELGTWAGWTPIGTAFGSTPANVDAHTSASGYHGSFYADSYVGASEAGTGELKSDSFIHPVGTIEFIIGGWTVGSPSGNETLTNYVGLYLASDDSELARVEAPNSNASISTNIYSSANYGDSVYLKIVDTNDESDGGGWAWLYADNFQFNIIPEPATIGLFSLFGLALLRRK